MSARVTLPLILFLAAFCPKTSSALPWDVDMFRQQNLRPNEIARSPAEGTVPLGHPPWRMTTEEATNNLRNPVKASDDSIWRGRRLFSANCATCHGLKGDGAGPVGPQMAVPNILSEAYSSKPEGSIYGVLMNGGANMPRYGWKFSDEERWHLVNYVRFLQGKNGGSGKLN